MTLYLDSVITFGKYKGKRVSNVPKQYLTWLKENTQYKVKHTMKPKVEELTLEKFHLTFLDLVRLENNFRITCMNLGRKLIYNNIEVPFE